MDINKDIIQACIKQERAAQGKVYKTLLPYLRAVAHRYLKDTSYVKDVLQESFIKIFRSLEVKDDTIINKRIYGENLESKASLFQKLQKFEDRF